MEQPLSYVGLEEAARRLGVPYWRIRHAHRAGHIEEPPRISNRRVYGPELLEKLRLFFATRNNDPKVGITPSDSAPTVILQVK